MSINDRDDSSFASDGGFGSADMRFWSGKIRVFLSSPMGGEGEFSWIQLRREITDAIDASDLFAAFAIENHTSFEPSRSVYLSGIEQSDVVVSVLMGELRTGTEDEIRYAVKLRKPLVLILVGEKQDEPTKRIVHLLHAKDYCTTVSRDSTAGLANYIVKQLDEMVIRLFQNKTFEIQNDMASGVGVQVCSDLFEPRQVLAAFGDSVHSIGRFYRCSVSRSQDECENPYLAPLGEALSSWILNGKVFSLESFVPTMVIAMSGSGVPEDLLKLRYQVLDDFMNKRYERAYENARLASELVARKDSWLYGNCLIDERNLAEYTSGDRTGRSLAAQNQLDSLGTPVTFPLANKYENSALNRILRHTEKRRIARPNSVTYDNSLAWVLEDLSSYLFASALYGSVASVNYARILIARALIEYSEIYSDSQMAYGGLQLLVLSGQAKDLLDYLEAPNARGLNEFKAGTDYLWAVSAGAIESVVPAMRCALARKAGAFFSDETFEDVQSYLSDNVSVFADCLDSWGRAIDSIKLRMDQKKLATVLCEMVSKRLYLRADRIGRIILGAKLDDMPEDSLRHLVETVRSKSQRLIDDGMPISAFAVLGKQLGTVLLNSDQVESLTKLQREDYLVILNEDNGGLAISSIEELYSQYTENNTKGRHIGFFRKAGLNVCNAIEQGFDSGTSEVLESALKQIFKHMPDYEGFSSSLDDPMMVVCKYACAERGAGKSLDGCWLSYVEQLDESDAPGQHATMLGAYNGDIWKIRVRCLRVVMNLDDSMTYVALGIAFGELSPNAQSVYLQSLEWLIESGAIADKCQSFICEILKMASSAGGPESRVCVVDCIASCCRKWGLSQYTDILVSLSRDESGNVVYEILRLCKARKYGNSIFEDRMIELLSKDSNWFIRWHAVNDATADGVGNDAQ